MYDFYNYKAGKPEFFRVLYEFLQVKPQNTSPLLFPVVARKAQLK